MLADLETLVRMQGLDLRAHQLRLEIAQLPKQIFEIEKALVSHARKLEADRALLGANRLERKQKDLDIQTQQAKIAKLKDQMNSAKTNEQFKAFQNEIQYCEQEIAKHEDRVVALMEAAEPLAANVKSAEAALAEEKAQVDKQKAEATERTAADQAALAANLAERKELMVSIPNPLLTQFERLSKKYKGLAISDASSGRCAACNLEIRPMVFQELRRLEKILTCDYCGRLLHYNPAIVMDVAPPPPPVKATRSAKVPAAPKVAAGIPSGTRVDMS